MLFNSIHYAFFLPVVFVVHWLIMPKNVRSQNNLLLISSYYFYGCWDWRFLFLLLFSTSLDYYTGLKIESSSNTTQKKFWLWLSITINLGFLGIFKYFDFFSTSFSSFLSLMGFQISPWTLGLILPIGISFYTFHGLSYVIDIYYSRIKAENNFFDYALFVTFFPLLVAGPIERATHLLPQLKHERKFNYQNSVDGLRQILWGLFKKIVIADSCGTYSNLIFDHSNEYSGGILVAGAFFFAIQIYGDFSGYSDIALGTARLFGIELLRNFAYPYFSRDIPEFWRRWHISLSSWFRDYLYIPLGGGKGTLVKRIRNVFVIFIVSGFWHGANFTFLIWGLLNAIYFIPSLLVHRTKETTEIVAQGRLLPSIREFGGMILTFSLTLLAWIFFRAKTLSHAFQFIEDLFRGLLIPKNLHQTGVFLFLKVGYGLFILLIFFFLIEWLGREKPFAIATLGLKSRPIFRWAFYMLISFMTLLFSGTHNEFIYFQF